MLPLQNYSLTREKKNRENWVRKPLKMRHRKNLLEQWMRSRFCVVAHNTIYLLYSVAGIFILFASEFSLPLSVEIDAR